MSLIGIIELTQEIMEDSMAKCNHCGAPATGGYFLTGRIFAFCDKPECREKCDQAVIASRQGDETKTVRCCARCGGDHQTAFRELQNPIVENDGTAWTHWGLCETNWEPILMKFSETEDAQTGNADKHNCTYCNGTGKIYY